MVLCLFIGFLMAAGMMSAVPIYMDASLQRMLIKDMESYQLSTGDFPGIYSVSKTIGMGTGAAEQRALIDELPARVRERVGAVRIPVGSSKTVVWDNLQYLINGTNKEVAASTRVKLAAMTDFSDHIVIKSGRMFCEGGIAEDGVFEVVASDTALKSLEAVLNGEYEVRSVDTGREAIRVRIVGVYEQSDPNDIYWSETADRYVNALITDYSCFTDRLLGSSAQLTAIIVNYSLS